MSNSRTRKSKYTQQEIIERYHFTAGMIRRYLPAPELVPDPVYKNAAPLKLWTRESIAAVLKDPEVQAALSRNERQKRRKNRKSDSVRNYLLSFDISSLRETASMLDRRFVLHIGPTNSGKTHDALEDLKKAESGLYLGPLRLLALEMYDRLNEDLVRCNLLTGEESVDIPGALHTASTIELCDYTSRYDVVVIDEGQMITDPSRGDRWVKAIYCVDAAVVEICLAPEAEKLIVELIESFGGSYEIVRHERLAPLRYTGLLNDVSEAQPGDALIVFSRRAVLAIAAELEGKGISCSVLYGALPPVSRREEVRKFTSHETQVVVATDAIGMGVSLPIKRIIFCELQKFDGIGRRDLSVAEIRQIAGRAGRYGMYDEGEVLSMAEGAFIRNALNRQVTPLKRITIPFPGEAINSEYALDELLGVWMSLPADKGFMRADMKDALYLYRKLSAVEKKLDKELAYLLITCPVDTGNPDLVFYWLDCARAIVNSRRLQKPWSGTDTLEECELRYKQYDIRHQLLRRINVEENCMPEKLALCEKINSFLKKDKDQYLRRCRRCGRILPATGGFGLCQKCFNRMEGMYKG